MCCSKHSICMNKHIYSILAARRRVLGLSQQALADLAGLRREKVNRVESRREDISLADLGRLLDAVGLTLVVAAKDGGEPLADAVAGRRSGKAIVSQRNHKVKPGPMAETSFINGARAKIVHWGKVPR